MSQPHFQPALCYYVLITYRQRQPNGQDLPRVQCEKVRNGPFTSAASAEQYAASVANQTAVFQAEIVCEEIP